MAIFIGIMLNIWLGAAIGFLSIGVVLFTSIHSLFVGMLFVASSFFCFSRLGRLILFKNRVADYIVEGQTIIDNERYSNVHHSDSEYKHAMNIWSKRVFRDIYNNKSKSEAISFLDKGITKSVFSHMIILQDRRHEVAQIVGSRLSKLKDLQKRL